MKTLLTLSLVLCTFVTTIAQEIKFEQMLALPPAPQNIANFEGVRNSYIAHADIDGDNDIDVLITGLNNSDQSIAKLYINDGLGNFSEQTESPFIGVNNGSISFADVDGDDDQDLIITGLTNSQERIAKLYTNNGNGIYTEVSETPFVGVDKSTIAFADVDGDDDQDVLIKGATNSYQYVAKLYINNGNGNFTEESEPQFPNYSNSAFAFVDVDGDNDQDVLIAEGYVFNLYTNDGSGNFTKVTEMSLPGNKSIAFADVDGDNDQDVLISGYISSSEFTTKLYSNDGLGNFSEVSEAPFENIFGGSIAFSDIDGDNDQDVFISGGNGEQNISKLYINNGFGTFTEESNTSFAAATGSIAFFDADGDNDHDLIITGVNNSNKHIAKLYCNNGIGKFFETGLSDFTGVFISSIAFADIDSDNDQDLLLTGMNNSHERITKLYSNNGIGNFSEVNEMPFDSVCGGSVAFADIDGDDDQDVLIIGSNADYQSIVKLYSNDGLGNFSEIYETPFVGAYSTSIAFADIDNDNDQDLLITGYMPNVEKNITQLYTNDGNGNFIPAEGTPFDSIAYGSIAFADIDGDNDMDLLITGNKGLIYQTKPVTKLYTNDGNGNFSEDIENIFDSVYNSSVAFADIDGDNDLDVLIAGKDKDRNFISKLYTNDGSGTFTEVTETPFVGVENSSISFADVDGDNDYDLLITGAINNDINISKLYTNDGNGNFSEVTGMPFEEVYYSSIAFSDVNGDNALDVVITGKNNLDENIAKLYKNNTCHPKTGTDFQTACESFTWIDGNTYTESNNNATFILTNAAGCDSIVTLDLTIVSIDVSIETTDSTITANQEDAIYQWLNCDNNFSIIENATEQTFKPTESGNYAVKINIEDCADTSECVFIEVVGINENSAVSNIQIYPNPTNGEFKVTSNKIIQSIEITSISGQLIERYELKNNEFELNITNQPKGIYIIKIQSNTETIIKRIAKK